MHSSSFGEQYGHVLSIVHEKSAVKTNDNLYRVSTARAYMNNWVSIPVSTNIDS